MDKQKETEKTPWAEHGFCLLHLGVNCANPEQSKEMAQKMAFLFGFELRERPNSSFAGTGFEFMKQPDLGEKGHIAIGTYDVARAARFLEAKGIHTLPGTERYEEDGTLRRVYLDLDVMGFAVHLRKM
ncbi:MAG: VOC family protein [Synergistaceae bacterium]|jgi:2-dehydro-3-deoxyphosphogluconate aldolase/(4S)-4-hydroxy-2-oxoglutarate aldolase|nr:VOC family protein [Synergistaceae bacterium]